MASVLISVAHITSRGHENAHDLDCHQVMLTSNRPTPHWPWESWSCLLSVKAAGELIPWSWHGNAALMPRELAHRESWACLLLGIQGVCPGGDLG